MGNPGTSFSPVQLCYPGKRIELRRDEAVVGSMVVAIHGEQILVEGSLAEGECEVMVVFFAERYCAKGTVVRSVGRVCDGGEPVASFVVVEEGFALVNARSALRVAATLTGTYYLRPPALGVPCEVVDISVAGVALDPIAGESVDVGSRKMVSFDLKGREIRTVIEVVAVEPQRWRARFLKLGLSDEDAIASFIMATQVAKRQSLSSVEIRTSSSLDAVARLRYPVLEAARVATSTLTLSAGGQNVSLALPDSLKTRPLFLEGLVGVVRFGDFADICHFLTQSALDVDEVDVVAIGCAMLSAQLEGCSVETMVRPLIEDGWAGQPGPNPGSHVVIGDVDDGFESGVGEFYDRTGRVWSLIGRSLGVGLYASGRSGERQDEQVAQTWLHPRSLASLVARGQQDLVIGLWWRELASLPALAEILSAFAGPR
jgi:hypothetical protein